MIGLTNQSDYSIFHFMVRLFIRTVGKKLYIVITGYEVRDNYITSGGRDFPVAIIRVGKMVKAVKDTLKRVYRDDGN